MTEQECNVCNEIENGLYEEFSWLFRDDGNYIKMVNIVENAIDKYSQNQQNQKAIECLKDVLDHFTDRPTFYNYARQEICISDKDRKFVDYVNSKIKELEEE